MAPIQLSRRTGGGAQIVQGRSYIMLSREELDNLIVDLVHMNGLPKRAEKMATSGSHA